MQTNKLAARQWITAGMAVAMVLFSGAICAQTKGPDAGNYTASSTVYSFIDLVNGGGAASVLGGSDDSIALMTLPFTFVYYGNSYTAVCVSTNGLITFTNANTCAANDYDPNNIDLTSGAPPVDGPTLAPYWTDLNFQTQGAGAVYYQTIGTSVGSRRFVIEWNNAFLPASLSPVTFEVVLQETSNSILFQYQTVDLGSSDPATLGQAATVGIRDTAGNTNNRLIAWSYNAGVLTNGSAIVFAKKVATYAVGDVFPSAGTAIGNFGDTSIDTLDLLAVLRQVSGISHVDPCTDLYDAMDVYPLDNGSNRGGDASVNSLDLLALLRKVSGVDPARPTRAARVSCSVGTQLRERTPANSALRPNPEPRPNPATAPGVLRLGTAQQSGGQWRTPVYLHANIALNLGGLVLGVQDSKNISLKYVPASASAPGMTDNALPGRLALAWLEPQQVRAGADLLLGYIQSDNLPALQISISAHDGGSNRPLSLAVAQVQ